MATHEVLAGQAAECGMRADLSLRVPVLEIYLIYPHNQPPCRHKAQYNLSSLTHSKCQQFQGGLRPDQKRQDLPSFGRPIDRQPVTHVGVAHP
jgi:hypothetical protein